MIVTVVHYSDAPSLRVEVQNRGGASIGVSAIYIWSDWDDNRRPTLGFQIRREVAGKKGRLAEVKGPIPPVTIEGHNAQSWVIKPALIDELLEASVTDSIQIEVQFANGTKLMQKMTSKDIY